MDVTARPFFGILYRGVRLIWSLEIIAIDLHQAIRLDDNDYVSLRRS
jgi:hypothetical protein